LQIKNKLLKFQKYQTDKKTLLGLLQLGGKNDIFYTRLSFYTKFYFSIFFSYKHI